MTKNRAAEVKRHVGPAQTRALMGVMDILDHDPDTRSVTLSWSSEVPYERGFGYEVLSHEPGAARLERLQAAGPLVSEHDGPQIGVVDKVWIDGEQRRGMARVRFGSSPTAEHEYRDVIDKVRRGVSVRYFVHDMEPTGQRDGTDEYTVTDWEPTHIAIVAEPADITVGTGRDLHSDDDGDAAAEPQGVREVSEETKAVETPKVDVAEVKRAATEAARKAENERAAKIRSAAKRMKGRIEGLEALEQKALEDGTDPAEFGQQLLDAIADQPVEAPAAERKTADIGLSEKESKSWSWARAIKGLVAAHNGSQAGLDDAGFEFEASRAVAEKLGADPKGVYVPNEAMRAMTVGTATAGGNTVATDLRAGSFIEQLLAPSPVTSRATVFEGLVGDVDFPAGTALPTAYYVAEATAITAESSPTIGKVSLSPNELGVYTDLSRKLMKQSSMAIDNFVQDRQAVAIRQAIEVAIYNGSGTNQPEGIFVKSGIGDVTASTTYAGLYDMLVDLKTDVRVANAEAGDLVFVTTPEMAGILEKQQKFTTNPGGDSLWMDGMQGARLCGYPAYATNLMPKTLGAGSDHGVIFGNWRDVYLGFWGALDVTLDTSSLSTAGGLRIVSFLDFDLDFAHVGSFSKVEGVEISTLT